MAYGCGGSSPPFRTIYTGNNDAKLSASATCAYFSEANGPTLTDVIAFLKRPQPFFRRASVFKSASYVSGRLLLLSD